MQSLQIKPFTLIISVLLFSFTYIKLTLFTSIYLYLCISISLSSNWSLYLSVPICFYLFTPFPISQPQTSNCLKSVFLLDYYLALASTLPHPLTKPAFYLQTKCRIIFFNCRVKLCLYRLPRPTTTANLFSREHWCGSVIQLGLGSH